MAATVPVRPTASLLGSTADELRSDSRTIIILCYLGYLLSFADRVIFGLVLKPMQTSLHFTDAQLGALSGLAFAISYAVFSPLSGFLIDRYHRKTIFIVAVVFWSCMTLLTGVVSSFFLLGVVRAMVGVGEAFMHPLAVSLISDAVAPERRARVFSLYVSAGAVGGIFAYIFGGLILHKLAGLQAVHVPLLGMISPWRVVFISAGVPGLLLVLLILLLLQEPSRRQTSTLLPKTQDGAMAFVRRYWVLLIAMFIGLSTIQLGAYTWSTWAILFFGRIHHWSIAQAALFVGIPGAAMALLGCLASGRVIEAMRRKGYSEAPLRVGAFGGLIFASMASFGVIIGNPILAAVILVLASAASYVPTIGIYAAMGDVLPAASRGRFAGLSILAVGLITNSLGPLLVGFMSDRVFRSADGLRFALSSTFILSYLVGLFIVLPGMSSYRKRMSDSGRAMAA